VSNRDDELWSQAHRAFEGHRLAVDPNAQAALNRIAAKCLRISFDPTNCTIREAVLDAEALRQLHVFHNRASPASDHEPIVVLSFKGKEYVIDGNSRVNLWRRIDGPQLRRAIVIEPTQAGYATWLMRPVE
jgi:hypothetical protein